MGEKKIFFFSPKLKDHLVAGEGVGVCVVSPENQLPQADTSVGNQTKKKKGVVIMGNRISGKNLIYLNFFYFFKVTPPINTQK